MSKNKTNQQKVEKVVSKKLKKLIKRAAEATGESRLVVMTSKDYLLVKAAKEKEGTSFIDQYLHIVHGLDNQVKMIRDYDGKDLKQVNMTPFALGTTDFAAIQGLDVDELADREVETDHDGDHTPHKSKVRTKLEEYLNAKPVASAIFPQITIDDNRLQPAVNLEADIAFYKSSHELMHKKIEKLHREIDELRDENTKLNEEIKKLTDELEIKTAKNNSLTLAIEDMRSQLDKAGQISATYKDIRDMMDIIGATEEAVDETPVPETKTTDDIVFYGSFEDFAKYNRIEILPSIEDTHMFTFLDNLKELRSMPDIKTKTYDMEDIIRELGHMYKEFNFNGLAFDLYVSSDSIAKKSYTETAYALVIAAAAPASYVGKFTELLLTDYRKGLFVPTRKQSIPKNFEEMLEGIYPEVMRIQDLLFKDATRLPYLYSEEDKYRKVFYAVGCEKTDSARKITYGHKHQYVVVPKCANPYDFTTASLAVFTREAGHTELKDVSLSNNHYTLRMQLEEYAKDTDFFPEIEYPKTWQEWLKFAKENMVFYNVVPSYSVPVKEKESKE